MKITLPVSTLARHTFDSPIVTNDPSKKIINFVGQFYIIKREVYEQIGTHESVREKFGEDTAIGIKLKEQKFKLRLLRGEQNLQAETTRSLEMIFNQVSRYLIPYYEENKLRAIYTTLAVFTVMFSPFLIFPYSIILITLAESNLLIEILLFVSNIVTILIIITMCSLQSKYALYQNWLYGVGAIIGTCIFSTAYIIALAMAIRRTSVSWRDRKYDAR
jgi:hypothetical protein